MDNFEDNYDSLEEISSTYDVSERCNYDDKIILKNLLSGKTREEIALELNHKSYRTIDMYMRRRGYVWNTDKQIYVKRNDEASKLPIEDELATSKIQRIITLFNSGIEPMEIAKKVGMKDHRAMAVYMKAKGYSWSSEKQNYVLVKGLIDTADDEQSNINDNEAETIKASDNKISNESVDIFGQFEKFVGLIPMLEMINKNKDKVAEILAINTQNTIPRYIVGGVTITKSLCMSHPLAELIKEFSFEKNISQREIFEVAIIEFLKKYGFENEINSLFQR